MTNTLPLQLPHRRHHHRGKKKGKGNEAGEGEEVEQLLLHEDKAADIELFNNDGNDEKEEDEEERDGGNVWSSYFLCGSVIRY